MSDTELNKTRIIVKHLSHIRSAMYTSLRGSELGSQL